MVLPDTSPRGHEEIPTENDAYDFGTGAGFYLNATKDPWKKNYQMYIILLSNTAEYNLFVCAAEVKISVYISAFSSTRVVITLAVSD